MFIWAGIKLRKTPAVCRNRKVTLLQNKYRLWYTEFCTGSTGTLHCTMSSTITVNRTHGYRRYEVLVNLGNFKLNVNRRWWNVMLRRVSVGYLYIGNFMWWTTRLCFSPRFIVYIFGSILQKHEHFLTLSCDEFVLVMKQKEAAVWNSIVTTEAAQKQLCSPKLSICLSVYLSICLPVCLSVWWSTL